MEDLSQAIPFKVDYGNIIKEVQMIELDVNIICDIIKNMPENGLMVEWGSGGSTCKWIDTLTANQKLISIEHNENWYNRVKRAISSEWGDVSNKFTYHHIPEKNIEHGYGNLMEEHPCGTDEYIHPNDSIWDADVYLVDGIARATCLMTILYKKNKKDSVILIHDYVGRENWYSWVIQFFEVEVYNDKHRHSTLAKLTVKN